MTSRARRAGYRRGVDGPTFWERLRRVNPLIWDSLLAAAVAGLSILGATLGDQASQDPARGPLTAVSYALLVLGSAPLALRRRWPIAVLATVGACSIALSSVDHAFDLTFAVVIASYTAAAHVDRDRFVRLTVPISLVAAAASLVLAYAGTNWVEVLIGATFSVGLPMLFGRIGYNRRRRIAVERDRAAHDAVAEERSRIARELHDVVAHAMSVMVVQAGAARSVLDHDREAARTAIGRIETTGRDGMIEMRRLIAILKDDGADAALAPQPSLAQLDGLVDTVREAGVPVEVVVEGTPRSLPSGLDLIAYRVVQEALTNVIKHAGRASARVGLGWHDDGLDIEVADDGRGGPVADGPGHGLIGMRERVALYGGSLETAPRPGGGFLLRVRLPLTEVTP
jgi:signal transduction histidine kinase